MRAIQKLFLVTAMLLSPCWAWAQITAVSNNSSLTYHITGNRLPLVLQWNVDGRDIWVFPASRDLTFKFRNDHFHAGGAGIHVAGNQMHAQGPLATPGLPLDSTQGQVYAGVVYSVIGSGGGSGQSVISEKIHIYNGTTSNINLELIGMGFKASEDEYAGPPLTDLSASGIVGSSLTFVDRGYIAVNEFGPLTQYQFISFRGFNPESSVLHPIVRPGEHVTMITELKLGF